MANLFVKGVEGECPLPNVSIGRILYDSLKQRDVNSIILFDEASNKNITFQSILEESVQLAKGLRKLGVKKNDVVAIVSDNRPEYASTILAILYIGAIINPVNPSYVTRELKHAFDITKPKVAFLSESVLQSVMEIKSDCNYMSDVVVYGEGTTDARAFQDMLVIDSENLCPVDVDTEEQVLAVLYSSGTTGLPKGVMITHHNTREAFNYLSDPNFLAMSDKYSTIALLPLYHVFGFMVMLGSLQFGLRLVLQKSFKPATFLAALQEHRINTMFLVPSLAVFLSQSPMVDKYDLSAVKTIYCGGAPLGAEVQHALEKRLNVKVRQLYGLTESTGVMTLTPENMLHKTGSSGKVNKNVTIKIVDVETQQPLGPNETGEICSRSSLNMKGYFDNEAATRDIFDTDGFLHTGDVGYYDDDGYFFIVERIKDLIKYKGFQVPPAELEDLLISHEDIVDAAVIGMPDLKSGELPLAFVVRRPGSQIAEQEIIDFIAGLVSTQKQLHGGVRFIEAVPKNPTGKILRRELRDVLKSEVKP